MPRACCGGRSAGGRAARRSRPCSSPPSVPRRLRPAHPAPPRSPQVCSPGTARRPARCAPRALLAVLPGVLPGHCSPSHQVCSPGTRSRPWRRASHTARPPHPGPHDAGRLQSTEAAFRPRGPEGGSLSSTPPVRPRSAGPSSRHVRGRCEQTPQTGKRLQARIAKGCRSSRVRPGAPACIPPGGRHGVQTAAGPIRRGVHTHTHTHTRG